jgi:hypothetical protein
MRRLMWCHSLARMVSNLVIRIPSFSFLSADHLNPVACYLGPEGIKQYLTHPYASPLFGDFNDLPPMLIQA